MIELFKYIFSIFPYSGFSINYLQFTLSDLSNCERGLWYTEESLKKHKPLSLQVLVGIGLFKFISTNILWEESNCFRWRMSSGWSWWRIPNSFKAIPIRITLPIVICDYNENNNKYICVISQGYKQDQTNIKINNYITLSQQTIAVKCWTSS